MGGAYRRCYLYTVLTLCGLAVAVASTAVLSRMAQAAGLGLSAPTEAEVSATLWVAIVLLLVAVPVWLTHLLVIAPFLLDPRERLSRIRRSYVTVWLLAAVITLYVGVSAFLVGSVGVGVVADRSVPLAAAIVAAIVARVAWRWRFD